MIGARVLLGASVSIFGFVGALHSFAAGVGTGDAVPGGHSSTLVAAASDSPSFVSGEPLRGSGGIGGDPTEPSVRAISIGDGSAMVGTSAQQGQHLSVGDEVAGGVYKVMRILSDTNDRELADIVRKLGGVVR